MKWKCGIGLLVLALLIGCGSKSAISSQPSTVVESSVEGITFSVPADWTAGKEGEQLYYTTPEKQVFLVNVIESESNKGDITDPVDRENFLTIARMEALNSHFTNEDLIDVGGKSGLRVSYDTLNKTEIMRVVHIGVSKDKRMYTFVFLMSESAKDASEYDQVMASVRFV